ncbi:MAG TPA: hypothetical protein VFZ65_19360 [Planctomycetota bacterium]|nr:hypothetical protein [Planctomycetota bacterium]
MSTPRCLLGLALCAAASAQRAPDPASCVRQLLDARSRPAAMHDLALAGAAGAHAVLDAFLAAADRGDDTAPVFAAALAELGTATASEIPRLVEVMARHGEPVRCQLLRALANGALLADENARQTIGAALPAWAAAGLLYSPSADRATFAWYEYVRLVRRMKLSAESRDAAGVLRLLDSLRASRGNFNFGGRVATHYEIEAHGAHGQREELEGIAELALACPGDMTAVVAELTGYLEASPPRPPIVRTEHCAGIGENAPNALPGVKWPTCWLYDEWHFACARAVYARSSDVAARQLALRHLLHASNTALRLFAIESVRDWPQPWQAFAVDLADCLHSDERAIVREALVTISQCPVTAREAASSARQRARLQEIANGTDRELATLARRALLRR